MTDLKEIDGVGKAVKETLEENGYNEVIDIATSSPKTLQERTDLGEKKSNNIVEAARDLIQGNKFVSGDDVAQKQEERQPITTSSEKLDGLLKGGIPSGYTTQLYGEFSSGKTQLCHQLAVNAQLPREEGGLNKGAIYIDSEDTFVADRIEQIAEAQGLDPEEVLSNIKVASVHSVDDQKNTIMDAKTLDLNEYGVLIVDSLTAHFRTEFKGRSDFSDRSRAMGEQLSELSKIAKNYEIPVVYTNQTYASPDGNPYTDPTEAYGGNTLAHNSTFILYLQDRQSKGWAAKLVDSPSLPQNEVYFQIDETGITDVE